MTSLTTLFVVGKEEYVEFNESMGSKAFVEHIWDQSKTPLKLEDTSANGSQLHSAGARISSDPPPRIEFPTVVRLRGRGNKYRATGKYISWEELKKRNPVALKDPPSLEEFIRKGSQVGTAERLAPGAFLKGEKKFKINKKPQETIELHQSQDGWIGGSSESSFAPKKISNNTAQPMYEPQSSTNGSSSSASIYAPKPSSNGSFGSMYAPKSSAGSSESIYATKPPTESAATNPGSTSLLQNAPEREAQIPSQASSGHETKPNTLRKSRSGLSLSARLGIDPTAEQSEKQPDVPSLPQKHAATRRPSKLTLPDNRISILPEQERNHHPPTESRTPVAQTPLSASHPPPETPLKHHGNRNHIDIPPTPNTEQRVHDNEMKNFPKAGLMLDPGQSNLSQGGSQSGLKGTSLRAARSQMDDMLARLRQARSGFSGGGSGQSMWAPKSAVEDTSTEIKSKGKTDSSSQATPTLAPVDAAVTSDDAELTPKLSASKPAEAKGSINMKASKSGALLQTKELTSGKSLLDRLGPKSDERDDTPTMGRPAASKDLTESNATSRADTSAKDPVAKGGEKKVRSPSNQTDKAIKKDAHLNAIPIDDVIQSAPTEPKADRIKKVVNQEIVSKPILPLKEDCSVSHGEDAVPQAVETVQSYDNVGEATSQVGDDTMSSINWADDDDDSLPELTEEWMKTALLSPPTSTKKTLAAGKSPVASDDSHAEHEMDDVPHHLRERKGRGAKQKREAQSPRGPKNASKDLGIRIAGSADKQKSESTSNEDHILSSVPPWQRRSKAAEPLGLRIAGQAERKSKEAKGPGRFPSDSKGKRNAHPWDPDVNRGPEQAPAQNQRSEIGSNVPSSAASLQIADNSISTQNSSNLPDKKTRSKGRGRQNDRRKLQDAE